MISEDNAPPSPPQESKHKTSYTIPCSSAFRDQVLALAERRGVNAADLARAVILTIPLEIVSATKDPGGPEAEDREPVILQSGPSKGKPWRRKPRLQVRLPKGYNPVLLRKALGLALRLDRGDLRLTLESAAQPTRDQEKAKLQEQANKLQDKADRFRTALSTAMSEPLSHPVRTVDEALFVLGFPPGSRPTAAAVKAKFRQLATIHHPDYDTGDTQRMTQLNQAMSFIRSSLKN